MSIIVKEPDQKDWERPEDGTYVGVIADVIDLGEVQTGFGVKPKVQIMWLLDAFDSDGHQHRVFRGDHGDQRCGRSIKLRRLPDGAHEQCAARDARAYRCE